MDYPYLLGVTTHGSSLGTLHTVLRSRHELVAISIGSTYKGYEKKLQIKVGRYFLGLPACQTSQPLSGYVQIWKSQPAHLCARSDWILHCAVDKTCGGTIRRGIWIHEGSREESGGQLVTDELL